MIDFDRIQKLLEEKLGTREYRSRVLQIATLLDRLDMDADDGAEELIAKEIFNKISGKTRYIKDKDVLDAQFVSSLDRLTEAEDGINTIESEQIQDFVNLGHTPLTHSEKRTLKSKIDQIKDIEKEVQAGKKLIEIPIGKQTANDWLSDVVRKLKVGDSEFLQQRIAKIRKKSQENYRKSTATDLIRRVVTKNDLKNLNSREICEKYELDYNGTTRKFISRLKLKLEET
jgi:hypothetical protein